jgi:hypothetical protein
MERTFNPDEWISGLEFLKTLNVEKIVPGHSWFNKVYYSKSDLDQHIEVLKAYRNHVINAIEKKTSFNTLNVPQSKFLHDLTAKIPNLPIKHQKRVTRQIESAKQYMLKRFYYYRK